MKSHGIVSLRKFELLKCEPFYIIQNICLKKRTVMYELHIIFKMVICYISIESNSIRVIMYWHDTVIFIEAYQLCDVDINITLTQ